MKKIVLLTCACLLNLASSAFAQNSFVQSYHAQNIAPALASMPGTGGYLMAAKMYAPGGADELHFLRLDANGAPQGNYTLSSTTNQIFPAKMLPLTSGGFVMAGYMTDPTFNKGLLVRLDPNGTVNALRTYELNTPIGGLEWTGLIPHPDSGFAAVGNGLMNLTPPQQAAAGILARLDNQGDTLWTRFYGFENYFTTFRSGLRLAQGDYLVVGHTSESSPLPGIYNQLLLQRVSPAGDLLWTKTYALPDRGLVPTAIATRNDGRVYVSAVVDNGFSEPNSACLFAIDTAGTLIWANEYLNVAKNYALDLALSPLGYAVMVGASSDGTFVAGMSICVDDLGAVRYTHEYRDVDLCFSILPTADGGYLMSGRDLFLDPLLYVQKTGPQGELYGACAASPLPISSLSLPITTFLVNQRVGSGCILGTAVFGTPSDTVSNWSLCNAVAVAPAQEKGIATVAPQPMHSVAQILLPSGRMNGLTSLLLHDLHGRVLTCPVTRLQNGFEVQRGDLSAGIYAYQVLQSGQRIASGKLWIAD
jgi:outer membrane protein assembly factor BamB